MKKSLVIISFAFIFLLSMSIISAGDINQDGKISFGEWLKGIWGKITGKAAGQPSPPIISWTQWFDYDSPGGSGDYELLTSLRTAYPGKICDSPANIECQTTTGLDYTATGEIVTCDVTKGAICVNAQQPDGTCNYDYKVRFYCGTTCSDSDGNDITNQGIVSINDGFTLTPSEDSCVSSSTVTEYTCSSSTALQSTATNSPCSSGESCQNGACVRVISATTCSDSDGNNITNQGIVTIDDGFTLTPSEDSCVNSSTVTEYTCSSPTASQSTATNYPCLSGESCQNGLCSSCQPNYVKSSCIDDVAVFKDTSSCNLPDYNSFYDCDGNGLLSWPACSGINLNAEGNGVFINFLPFNNLTNYTNMGNKTMQLAENYQGIEFDWDFSDKFNFCDVSLETSDGDDNFGYVVFDYTGGKIKNKDAFVDRINKSGKVCIKDAPVKVISDVSAKCNAPNEILIDCPGNFTAKNPTYNYNCTITPDELQYQIWPLKHSAVKEMVGLVSAAGNGTGVSSCTENWNCTDWTNMTDQCGERICADLNNCGTTFDKPLESKDCSLVSGECISDWTCTDYGECVDGFKERVCTDSNNCEVGTDKPDETSKCGTNKIKSILFIIFGIVGLILIILIILYFIKKRKSDEEDSETQVHHQPSHPRSPPHAPANVHTPRIPLTHQR